MKELYMTKIQLSISFLIGFLIFVNPVFAQPPGFVDELLSDDWNTPTGLTFDKTGQLYVWTKPGQVFAVNKTNGEKSLLLDLNQEVYDYLDHGLNGLALHPDFEHNGYMYLLYTVDRNYLYFKDSSFYDPGLNDQFSATIGRITRYTLDSGKVVAGSRKIILGDRHDNGIPILMDNHGVGSLVFGADTSLLVTAGDVAIAKNPPFQNGDPFYYELVTLPLEEGIITEDQNIGPYRSQHLNSLNGKLLRINPETGEGYSSNPFYEEGNPASAASRIWAYGLRNPFRFSVKPGTGSTNVEDGSPGEIYVGDVGWASREEINVITEGGQNFGWPYWEGISYDTEWFDDPAYKPENPLPPILEWRGDRAQAFIEGEAYGVGSPEFKGENFTGNSAIGGLWLTTDHFPGYKDTYIAADYQGWIRNFKFDFRGLPYEVELLVDGVHPTCIAEDPTDGSLYYVNLFYPSTNEIRHLYNEENPNFPPETNASVGPTFGDSPLTVYLDARSSSDPEGGPLTFEWDFGNTLTSNNNFETFIYYSDKQQTFYPKVTITDQEGKSTVKRFRVFVNNYPPEIKSLNIDGISTFSNESGFETTVSATVENHIPDEVLFYEWSVILHHDEHTHLITSYRTETAAINLAPIPCDDQVYFYEVKLSVIDNEGLSSSYSHIITPVCEDEEPPVVLSLSPNPVNNQINIRGKDLLDETEVDYMIFDNHGRLLDRNQGVWKQLKRDLNSSLSDFNPGVYILKMVTEEYSQSFKFVKE
ncbi:PQQ-dependent sugar dehydrogenase [Jiulongibacter sp. NS-SX5]|uniref:PQQ-dependent sugar dehydrogenase n=1 Tax=Jiulongibacter sp. NS-SX5 TaxID=3463854 RepID=UPI004059FD96